MSRDHNATSYSTETFHRSAQFSLVTFAEIITLRAIALKPVAIAQIQIKSRCAEIITLRAIALKLTDGALKITVDGVAEIITLRAIALKQEILSESVVMIEQRS